MTGLASADVGSVVAVSVTGSEAFVSSTGSTLLDFASTGSTGSTAVGSTALGSEALVAAYLTVSPSVRSRKLHVKIAQI